MTVFGEPFDPAGPLPTGLTALEASAGTGKTYALTSLAVRFVAEQGVTAGALCIVSFTEAATAELRGRVRGRLVAAARHLESLLSGAVVASPDDDPVLAAIARVDDDGRRERLGRLRAAIAEFDAATITTIHGFCGRVLAAAGTASAERRIDTGGTEAAEVVNDLYLARFGHLVDTPVRADRLRIAVELALGMPDAVLHLPDPPDKVRGAAQERYLRDAEEARRLVADAVAEVRRRRESRRRRTFDSLLADTRDLLTGPEGAVTVAALRDRLRVVLIDEFQDTDRVQWDIFRTAFVGAPATAVVLVGDPKQSIYRFRSAELSAYLDAVGVADHRATLATNWRSDGPLLTALETFFTSPDDDLFEFGAPEVAFAPVAAAPGRDDSCLVGDGAAPLVVRLVPEQAGRPLPAPTARRLIAVDLVDTVQRLLTDGLAIVEPAGDVDASAGAVEEPGDQPGNVARPVRERPLSPRDIAVLTRSNADASSLAARLGAAGIPAATSSSNSVLESEAAEQWRRLLRALERPGSAGRVRAAALGWFVGRRLDEIAALDESGLDALHDELRRWVDELARGGVAALLGAVRAGGLDRRLLAQPGGERHITDLDHIGELLLTTTSGRGVGPSELLDRLTALAGDEAMAPASDLLARRIDRDDDAVQVLTVHKAKGLEFPVVLCPSMWSAASSQGVPHAQFGDRRHLDLSWVADANWAFVQELRGLCGEEIAGEARRLLYVALTRARHRLYLWWPVTTKPDHRGPLATALRTAAGLTELPTTLDAFAPFVERSGGTVEVGEVRSTRPPAVTPEATAPDPVTPAVDAPERGSPTGGGPGGGAGGEGGGPSGAAPGLSAAIADRPIDRSWRIWSFTAVTAAGAAPEPSPVSAITGVDERPVMGGVDEPSADQLSDTSSASDATQAPLGRLRRLLGGTEFGTLVHEILEHTDFAAASLHDDLTAQCSARLRHRSLRIEPAELAAGLADAVRSPLGGQLGTRRLADIARPDRLDELEFHLPLGRLRAGDLGRVLADHLAADDPFRAWASTLASGGAGLDPQLDLSGRLTGSIDLVWRADGRFHAGDYKTNQLGADHPYDPAGLVSAMEHHHYPLQAILYLVALHRYLRWRLVGYDPAEHLGGAAYLFLRGMQPDAPTVPGAPAPGVLWWHPGIDAISAVDRLLAGEAP